MEKSDKRQFGVNIQYDNDYSDRTGDVVEGVKRFSRFT